MDLNHVLEYIQTMDAKELELAMDALEARKRQLYTDWEICYMAIPKSNQQQRSQTIRYIMDMLQKMDAESEEI